MRRASNDPSIAGRKRLVLICLNMIDRQTQCPLV